MPLTRSQNQPPPYADGLPNTSGPGPIALYRRRTVGDGSCACEPPAELAAGAAWAHVNASVPVLDPNAETQGVWISVGATNAAGLRSALGRDLIVTRRGQGYIIP